MGKKTKIFVGLLLFGIAVSFFLASINFSIGQSRLNSGDWGDGGAISIAWVCVFFGTAGIIGIIGWAWRRSTRTPSVERSTEEYSGIVKNLQYTSEPSGQWTIQVMSFQLIRIDEKTNQPLATIPVVMKCSAFKGFVSEDDNVKINARWEIGSVAEIKKIYNETTKIWVTC